MMPHNVKKEHAGIHIPDYMGSTQKATILIVMSVMGNLLQLPRNPHMGRK
jgi:hypothetical protein